MSAIGRNADLVVKVMRDRVEAMKADCLKRGIGIMPDGWKWLSEVEMREEFIKASSSEMDRAAAAVAFGQGMAQCERLGIVERAEGPGSTSIYLNEPTP